MQDDKVVEGKVRLARILGERMEKAFYPAARRSFTSETDVGTAFLPGRRRMSSLLLRIVMC